MTSVSTPEAMSSRGSHSPSAEAEEPRKKGKRSVSHLSKAQLARKRANDREAQRNIRQRTKEHIENLEKKVKELEAGGQSGSMERVLRRNQELEMEIDRLRAQLSSSHSTPSQIPSELSDDPYTQPKHELNWMPETSCPWPAAVPPHITSLESSASPSVSMGMTRPTYASDGPPYQPRSSASGYEQEMYASHNMQGWSDPVLFGQQSHHMSKQAAGWSGYHPGFNQPSRFGDVQQSGFTDMLPTLIS